MTSIFIKSHQRDFPWLEWCRKSIEKFCSGFHEIVLCLPEGESFDWPGAKIVHVRESFNPYLFQQSVKLYADTFCSGEYILYQDSDTCFDRPVTPQDFMIDGKPYWILRPYDQARTDQQVWRKPTSDFIGEDFAFEAMARHPFMVHRDVLKRIRGFCQFKHGVPLNEYIESQAVEGSLTALVFSEFNAIGAFAYNHCKDRFHWIDSSVKEPPPGCCYQGHTWGGEKRKLEDIAKFKEILGVNGTERTILQPELMTLDAAISLLKSQGYSITRDKDKSPEPPEFKRRGRPKGSKNKTKKASKQIKVANPPLKNDNGTLLCIHSYPGANETVERHWEHYQKFGADRIVGIGTDDGKCTFPGEWVNIGENAYLKGANLCLRLLATVKWCLTQPEDRFAIIEYDVLILKKFPKWEGVNAFLTGGKINGSKTNQFFHNPWLFDRNSGPALMRALEAALPDSATYPDNSPDLFFGLACERAEIKVGCNFKLFTRNSLDEPDSLDLAVQAALDGAHAIHGVKRDFEMEAILSSLNNRKLELSHVP